MRQKHMYKYRFHYLLRQLSVNDYEIAMKWIPERLCIAASTWKDWIYIKSEDKRQIATSQLAYISSYFQCSIEELFTEKPDINLHQEFRDELTEKVKY